MLLHKYQTDLIIAGLIFLMGFISAYLTWQAQMAILQRRMVDYQQKLQTMHARTETVVQSLENIQGRLAVNIGREAGSSRQVEQIRTEFKALIRLLKKI